MAIAQVPEADDQEMQEHLLLALDDMGAVDPDHRTGRFKLSDLGQAEWAMRKMRAAQSERDEIAALVKRRIEAAMEIVARELAPIQAWGEAETARLDLETAHWETLLIEYHRSVYETDEDPKHRRTKTLRLPMGSLECREGAERIEVDDEAAFLTWAENGHEDLLRITKAPRRDALRKLDRGPVAVVAGELRTPLVLDGDEPVPGVEAVKSEEPEFKVKLAPAPEDAQ